MQQKPILGQPQPSPVPAETEPDPGNPQAPIGSVLPAETGGRDGPDPTRFGDWEKNGRCIDF